MDHTQQERYAAAAQEDRSAHRNRISIPATLRPSGSKSFQTAVRDLSLSGFSATAMSHIAPRTMCWLTLPGRKRRCPQKWCGGTTGLSAALSSTFWNRMNWMRS
ncbi:PilZ domain-containing protein [Novosphingobium resinovorum]